MWVRFMPVDMCTSGSFIFRAAEKPVAGICHFSKEPWRPLRGLGVGVGVAHPSGSDHWA